MDDNKLEFSGKEIQVVPFDIDYAIFSSFSREKNGSEGIKSLGGSRFFTSRSDRKKPIPSFAEDVDSEASFKTETVR